MHCCASQGVRNPSPKTAAFSTRMQIIGFIIKSTCWALQHWHLTYNLWPLLRTLTSHYIVCLKCVSTLFLPPQSESHYLTHVSLMSTYILLCIWYTTSERLAWNLYLAFPPPLGIFSYLPTIVCGDMEEALPAFKGLWIGWSLRFTAS